MRLRNWYATLNNPTSEEVDEYSKIPFVRYFIASSESAPTTGTHHHHIYVEFIKPIYFSKLKEMLPRAHWERRRKTREAVVAYVKKEGTVVYERGEFIPDGARTDLDEVHSALDRGESMLYVAQEHFTSFCRYRKSFENYLALNSSSKLRSLDVKVYQGPPGTGKTYTAFTENAPDVYILNEGNNGIWFDGYYGQSTLIIDDFAGWIPLRTLLRILDVYPLQVETKGGHVQSNWSKVIITSNDPIEHWYNRYDNDYGPDLRPLRRRIHEVRQFNQPYSFGLDRENAPEEATQGSSALAEP